MSHKQKNLRIFDLFAVRISAVKCMIAVFQVHTECTIETTRQYQQIADCTFLLIPKIISTLTNVATGDTIIGEAVIMVRFVIIEVQST